MSCTKSKSKSATGPLQFVGPAQQSFDLLTELAKYTLDTYWPNWDDPVNPVSYISPTTFKYQHPEKGDVDIDAEKRKYEQAKQEGCSTDQDLSKMQRPVIDRRSDDGEFVVFQALLALAQESLRTSFLAVHGLNLDKLKTHFQDLFPSVHCIIKDKFEKMMREYDFVLIGPKIGIIVIEVKSAEFTKGKDFAPKQILDAINIQLNSFDPEFFGECAQLQQRLEIPLRRILFTPNLDKSLLQKWYDSKDKTGKEKVDKCFNGIIHWFKDDMANLARDSLKPALYSSLRRVIEADGFQLPSDIFEKYGPILVGLGSAQVFQNQQKTELNPMSLSTSMAALSVAAALDQQVLDSAKSKLKRPGIDIDEKAVLRLPSKVVLLTPEQQTALNGPNYQFIIGAPGTGKTVILQAKAQEMLEEGKSVLVFSTVNFSQRYKEALSGLTIRSLYRHANERLTITESRFQPKMVLLFLPPVYEMIDSGKPLIEILNHFVSISDTQGMQQILNLISIQAFDAIFFDDATDESIPEEEEESKLWILCILLVAITLGKRFYPSKMIWIALDPFLHTGSVYGRVYRRILEQIMRGDVEDYFSYCYLQRVMRCSESVFQVTYPVEVQSQMAQKPFLGHKIPGFSDTVALNFFNEASRLRYYGSNKNHFSTDKIPSILWKHVHDALDKFRHDGFDYGQMAVITGNRGKDNTLDEAELSSYISDKCAEFDIPTASSKESVHGKLVVDIWNNVSSLEWPVVIFAMADDRAISDGLNSEYQRYRACSRATMQIFQVIVQYNLPNSPWEADICREGNGRYKMGPVKEKTKESLHMSNMSETADQLVLYHMAMNGHVLYVSPSDEGRVAWGQTTRRSFSVHNLDLSTRSAQREKIMKRRTCIEDVLGCSSSRPDIIVEF